MIFRFQRRRNAEAQREAYQEGYDDGHAAGYASGKRKAYSDVAHVQGAGHVRTCGCEPCRTARAVLKAAVELGRL